MKKTLVALAALASIGSAFADAPTITPYARLDIGLKSTTTTGAPDSGLVGADSVYNTSLWGIKGDTDLGGGMKGFAQVEQKFAANGASGLVGDNNARVGKIGISGGFGSVAIGAQWGPYDNITIGDAQNYNGFSPYGKQLNSGAHGDNGNGGSQGQTTASIMYTSPSYAGFVYEVNVAPSRYGADNGNNSSWGADVQYTAGPLAIAAAYDHTPTTASNAASVILAAGSAGVVNGSDYSNAWLINGSYNLGVASVFAALNGATTDYRLGGGSDSFKDSGYSVGVSMPVGQWTVSGSFAGLKTTTTGFEGKLTSYGAQGLYAFNKQFTGYVGYISTKTSTDIVGSTDVTATKFGTGLTMSF
jgi:predicted porin